LEQRLPGKKLAQALKEMKQISRMDFVLFNKKGKMLASTVPDLEEKVQELVVLFAKSMADRAYAEELNQKADAMLEKYTKIADETFESVLSRLK
jgi:hypothetical protein